MNRRKLLVMTVSALILGGLLIVSRPFLSSLSPSAGAGALLSRIDISNLAPGEYTFQNRPISGAPYNRFYVLRGYDSKLYVYNVYLKDGSVQLPDLNWWRSGHLCKDFGPELIDGRLKPDGSIRCHDQEFAAWIKSSGWEWDYEGRNLSSSQPDMEAVEFKVEGNYIIVGRS